MKEEAKMHPLLLEEIAQQHIQDLQRQAQKRRLVAALTSQESNRRKEHGVWFRRAFAS
jgi:hypothetical protein